MDNKPKMGSIAWHQQKIDEIREANVKGGKNAHKTHHSIKKKKEPKLPKKNKFNSRVDYDFLKYLRIVMRWAQEFSGLSRGRIETLLYLYGCGTFTKNQFFEYYKVVQKYQNIAFKEFVEEGWIVSWRPASTGKNGQPELFILSVKGKNFCNRIHKYCAGIEEIPIKHNPVSKSEKRIDSYYMKMMKKMNKEI